MIATIVPAPPLSSVAEPAEEPLAGSIVEQRLVGDLLADQVAVPSVGQTGSMPATRSVR